MASIRGPREGCVVIPKVLPSEEAGPVCEHYVILGEALLCNVRGGDEDNGAGPKAEEKDWTVAGRKASEDPVERPLEEVEVAYYGEGRAWAWWEAPIFIWGFQF